MNPFDDDADEFVFVDKAKGSSASPWSDEKASASSRYGGGFDDGLDTRGFGGGGTSGFGGGGTSGFGGGFGEEDDGDMGYQNLQNQIQQRQDNMLQSTQRSKRLLYEAEDVGNETAHELLRQGEQLRNTEQKLDSMNEDLTVSQRHITSIKSVFGGIRNYFAKKPEANTTLGPENKDEPSKLESAITAPSSASRNSDDHPAFRLRDPDPSDTHDRYGGGYGGGAAGSSGAGYDDSAFGRPQSQNMKQFDEKLNANLDEMSAGLGRLKNLGLGLGDEIERQDDDIERITSKVNKSDDRILNVNKQLNKILYK